MLHDLIYQNVDSNVILSFYASLHFNCFSKQENKNWKNEIFHHTREFNFLFFNFHCVWWWMWSIKISYKLATNYLYLTRQCWDLKWIFGVEKIKSIINVNLIKSRYKSFDIKKLNFISRSEHFNIISSLNRYWIRIFNRDQIERRVVGQKWELRRKYFFRFESNIETSCLVTMTM
jgi:hypothetical protein